MDKVQNSGVMKCRFNRAIKSKLFIITAGSIMPLIEAPFLELVLCLMNPVCGPIAYSVTWKEAVCNN
jgi:hypothetical protein